MRRQYGIFIFVVLAGAIAWQWGPDLFEKFFPRQKQSSELPAVALILPEERRTSATVPVPVRSFTDTFAVPNAHAAFVMDATSGSVLYATHEHDQRQIASLTKIMTALLLMESGKNLNDIVVADEESIHQDGTTIGCGNSGSCQHQTLVPGEKVYLKDLLAAMLMNSANDAAVLIAKHISGNTDDFVELMNKRAAEMGLQNTHFCTPNGLEPDTGAENCYSSAYDVAQIVQAALKYPLLWSIMQRQNTTFTSVDGAYEHQVFNTNQLLGQYSRMFGAKTGFTPLAGYSLLSVGQDGDRKVIAVLLNDPTRWDDIRTVFDWAFTAFKWL
jgi:D-alanyl-D-alanine carboxypeptidase (penicillin-binding protein 5/6)